MIRRGFSYIFCGFFLLFLISCKENVGTLNVPGGLGDNYSLAFTDTVTVKTSTVLLDSLPTSNKGVLLLGKYNDDKLGIIESKPYFQICLGDSWTLSEDAIYDSLVLTMRYSGYSYGDITKPQTVEVHRVLEDFKAYQLSKFWYNQGLFSYFDNNNIAVNGQASFVKFIYNKKSFQVDASVLGTQTFIPKPNNIDSIRIKLDNTLGNDLFQKKKGVSNVMRNISQFIDYFKGIAITSTTNANIIGFLTHNTRVRLHYHEDAGSAVANKYHDFLLYDPNFQYQFFNYNNITADRSGTLLSSLSTDLPNIKTEISSTLTNDETYIQSGIGIATKLTFPGLFNIVNTPGIRQITSARLILEPVKGSYTDQNYLPSELVLFISNRANLPLQRLSANFSTQVPQFARITVNDEKGTTSGYSFTITQYVQSLVASGANSKDAVLLLTTSPAPTTSSSTFNATQADNQNNIYKTVTRVVLGNGQRTKYRARIELYYLKDKN